MRRFAFALAIALVPAGAVAQERSDYEAGVAARLAGHHGEARRFLQRWLAERPDDADAQLQLAYTELALGNLDAAQAGFEAVLRQAPDYADARQGLELVATRRTTTGTARNGYVLIEGAISDLSGGARDWHEAAAELGAPVSPSATVAGRGTYYRRFGREDLELTGQVVLHPNENIWLRALAGGTPNADFRPRLNLGAGVDYRLGADSQTVVTFDGSYQRFPLQDVVTFSPGFVQYFSDGRAWLTLKGIGSAADGGRLRAGGFVRGDYVPADRWRLFGGASHAPDTDLGIITRVTSLFAGAEAPLGDRFGLTGSAAREWRQGAFDRTELRLGVKAHF